jgi:zinc transporter ZupT
MSQFFLILGLFVISSVGTVLYFFKHINRQMLHLLISLWAGTMFGVALIHILPESLEQSPNAIYAFVLGFLLIYLLEEILTTHTHDHTHHDHTHEDPHEHHNHIVLVSWIAIFVHTLLDGLGIRAWFTISTTLGMSIFASIAIHQIPVSLSIGSMLRTSHLHRKTQLILVLLFGIAAPLWYIISDVFIRHISTNSIGLATALAGGSLLYVSNVELLPMIHAQSSKKMKFITVGLFVIWVVAMGIVALFE